MMLPRLIVVDRTKYTLDIFTWRLRTRRYHNTDTFLVTVGKQGSRTPHGLYFVQSKSRRPDWEVPRSLDYSEETWGYVYRYGTPGNPFDAGFISLSGKEPGIGIHGTSFDPKVGTESSHGCIRMRSEDLLAIYEKCKVDMPVYIH